jgi:glutaredoxin
VGGQLQSLTAFFPEEKLRYSLDRRSCAHCAEAKDLLEMTGNRLLKVIGDTSSEQVFVSYNINMDVMAHLRNEETLL